MRHATGRSILLLFATVVTILGGIATAAAAEPTDLGATAEASPDGVVVTGTLTSNGQPVGGAVVDVAAESTPVTTATTDEAGNFRAVAVLNPTAPLTLQVSFAGTADLEATSTQVDFAPEPVQLATTLSVSVADDTLYPGELLAISGTLQANNGPVPNGEINVFVAGREQGESLAFTGADGRFSTYAEVPTDLAAGETSLRVVHPGTGGTQASESVLTLTIKQPDPTPSQAESPTAEASATQPEMKAPPSAPATQEAGEATAEPTAEPVEPISTTNPFSWFWVGAVVVAGCATLVAIALLMRRAATREEKRERAAGIEPLYLLGDDEDADYDPEDHGWVTEEIPIFVDDETTETGAPEPTPATETTQPLLAATRPSRMAPDPEPEPGPSIYRDEEVVPQPRPRRSWSGEE